MSVIHLDDPSTWPAVDSRWKHYNGNLYRIVLVSNVKTSDQAKYPTTVVTANVHTGAFYSRPLLDWERSMTQVTDTR